MHSKHTVGDKRESGRLSPRQQCAVMQLAACFLPASCVLTTACADYALTLLTLLGGCSYFLTLLGGCTYFAYFTRWRSSG